MSEDDNRSRMPLGNYAGERCPSPTREQQKRLLAEQKKRLVTNNLLAKEVIWGLIEYRKAVAEGKVMDIRKAVTEDSVNDAVRQILRGKRQ